jgi:hypothetical protein
MKFIIIGFKNDYAICKNAEGSDYTTIDKDLLVGYKVNDIIDIDSMGQLSSKQTSKEGKDYILYDDVII